MSEAEEIFKAQGADLFFTPRYNPAGNSKEGGL
jgi:hypothetical protein